MQFQLLLVMLMESMDVMGNKTKCQQFLWLLIFAQFQSLTQQLQLNILDSFDKES